MIRATALVALVLLAACAFAGVLATTPQGIGLSADSASYVGSARSLLNGDGYRFCGEPLTHYPPGYAALLALSGSAAGDVLAPARWLGGAIFALQVLLVGLIVWRWAACAGWAVLAAALAACSWAMLYINAYAWSEGTYIVLALATLWMLAEHGRSGRWGWVVGAGAAAAAAWMTRYVGITLVMTGGAFLLVAGRSAGRPLRQRLIAAAIFGLIAGAPMLLWMARNHAQSGTATNREAAVHLITTKDLRSATLTAGDWLLPEPLNREVRGLGLLPLLAIAAFWAVLPALRRTPPDPAAPRPGRPLALLMGLHIAIFLLFLVVSMSFFDDGTRMNARILSPVYLPGLIAMACLLRESARGKGRIAAIAGIVLLVLAGNLHHSVAHAVESRREGIGYASDAMRRSPLATRVRELPAALRVYTNDRPAVYLLAGRDARLLPWKVNRFSQKPNPRYQQELQAMMDEVSAGRAVLVFYRSREEEALGRRERRFRITEEELAGRASLRLHDELDGSVWGAKKNRE